MATIVDNKKLAYGLKWNLAYDDLAIELAMIRHGGRWTKNGKEHGEGLFYHYRRAQNLAWPEEDDHRWSDLILKTILEERITVIQGSKDSGKTHGLSKFALIDYWSWPDETLILMSSTDIRGLELRVWGDVKDLFGRARDKFSWLPGNVVDAKHGIFTDSLGEEAEIRDMRKGIICIPCIGGNGEWTGISKYCGLKQKRRRLLGDECFVAGTLVHTTNGNIPIEKISVGDTVINPRGGCIVRGTMRTTTVSLCRVVTRDNRIIYCTLNHNFLTGRGWVEAKSLTNADYLLSVYEAMQIMREGLSSGRTLQVLRRMQPTANLRILREAIRSKAELSGAEVLLQKLRISRINANAIEACRALHTRAEGESIKVQDGMVEEKRNIEATNVGTDAKIQSFTEAGGCCQNRRSSPDEESRGAGEVIQDHEGNWLGVADQISSQEWSHESRGGVVGDGRNAGDMELRGAHPPEAGKWVSVPLQDRCGDSSTQTCDRGGRSIALGEAGYGERSEEAGILNGSWVESVEVLKQDDFEQISGGKRTVDVYNLHVADQHSYGVQGGLCVANCQFMRPSYMDSLSNLDKGDFKGAFVGNPLGQGDPLDKMAEPVGGWDSVGDVIKTTTWKNKFGGVTVNLVGIDSPNFDEPRGSKPKYPYMIAPEDADRVALRWGKDSVQYYSQIMGVRKPGLNAHRVLTREMCLRFGAFEDVIWSGKPTTRVYGIDASYGGDRCVGGFCEYGEDVNNVIVLKVHPPVIIPILVKSEDIPEDQIAHFVRADCDKSGIPPENVFYDSTGRGSLGTSFGRLWSTAVNPVEFGGTPTSRPVCHDIYVLDDRTKERRLKRCDEHYSKRVSEYWFSVRYTVESRQLRCMPQDVLDEFTMREWTMVKSDKIEIESKIDTKERMGCSPDLADWLAICVEGARRLGFRIERLTKPDGIERETRWLAEAVDRHKRFVRKTELSYQ